NDQFIKASHTAIDTRVAPALDCKYDCKYSDAVYEMEPVTWSSDGLTLYFFQSQTDAATILSAFNNKSKLVAFHIDTQRYETLVTGMDEEQWLVAGKSLAYGAKQGNVLKLSWIDLTTGDKYPLTEIDTVGNHYWLIFVSPNGQVAALIFDQPNDPSVVQLL